MDAPSLANEPVSLRYRNANQLSKAEAQQLLALLPAWQILTDHSVPHLQRSFSFQNFAEALRFTNELGALAEAANHHPQLITAWGKVEVRWWTHALHGLHRNDFIMAARCDYAYAVLFESSQKTP